MIYSRATLSTMALRITTLGIMIMGKMILRKMTHGIMKLAC